MKRQSDIVVSPLVRRRKLHTSVLSPPYLKDQYCKAALTSWIMDENLEFKNVMASASAPIWAGINKMYLMPYAKDLSYSDGQLSFTIELVNENTETEIGLKIQLADELEGLLERMMG